MNWMQPCMFLLIMGMAHHFPSHTSFYYDILREGHGTPLQYCCLESPMGGGVHGVVKSQTRLSDFTFTFTFMHWRRKWQPTPVFLPGESQGRGSLVGCCLWGRTESDTTEVTQQYVYLCVCTHIREKMNVIFRAPIYYTTKSTHTEQGSLGNAK